MLDNFDCLLQVLSHLPVRERESVRAVALSWSTAVDVLARTQKTLVIVIGKRQLKNGESRALERQSSAIFWPLSYIRYHSFSQMLERYPNVQSITFEGIEHWSDYLFYKLATACPRLRQLAFVRCVGLGRSRLHAENGHMNVTLRGWRRLVEAFGEQLIQLTLTDCDLDDAQLAIVVGGFRALHYLDLSGNRAGASRPLRDLPPGLQVLKVGPSLVGSAVPHCDLSIPIEAILEGPGRQVRELHLQGLLSSQLERLAEMANLQKLSIQFTCDDPAVVSSVLAAIGRLCSLKFLEFVQIDKSLQNHPPNSTNSPSEKRPFSAQSFLLASSWATEDCWPLISLLISCLSPLCQLGK